jgi:hypothetical protein
MEITRESIKRYLGNKTTAYSVPFCAIQKENLIPAKSPEAYLTLTKVTT